MTVALLEHTADTGIEVRAQTAAELFEEAARGLFELMVPAPETVCERERRPVALAAADLESLLLDWLAELIYLCSAERFAGRRASVTLSDEPSLTATVHGEALDVARHPVGAEIKAVTYHQFQVEQTANGWTARVIFDI